MVAAVAAPVQVMVGDWAARAVASQQPVKLAAIEGLGPTQKQAPLHVGGWYENGEIKYGLRIPYGLSLLAFHDPNARVTGLDSVPPRDRPPVNVVHLAFDVMVGIGTLMALFGVVLLAHWYRYRRLPRGEWFYRSVVVLGPLSIVALIAGWVVTEVGRQPWVVYGQLRTTEAVTGASGIPVGYATLVLVYLTLVVATVWVLRRIAREPLPA
jgi:cytochrome d ubiquinol oxidase subunit I